VSKLLDFGSAKDTAGNRKKLTVLGTTIGSPYYMAPEQAQGLETLDRRADVFALAAVAYECITGQVPFVGSNGPSILLAILTKDPVPPSVKGSGGKYPVPPGLDEVLEEALAKNPAIRTGTVGAFADAVGRAYGLTGDHKLWATVPLQQLGIQIGEALPKLLAPKVGPVDFSSDPFAAPPPLGGAIAPEQPSLGRVMDQAFAATREADLEAQGVPGNKPPWMLPVVVGFIALVVGGAVTLLVMMSR
jgi:serine/threonine-protein kinase